MHRFVPYEKLSKKKKKEMDRRRRKDWGGLNPVTRRSDPPSAYKRIKVRLRDADSE